MKRTSRFWQVVTIIGTPITLWMSISYLIDPMFVPDLLRMYMPFFLGFCVVSFCFDRIYREFGWISYVGPGAETQ